MRRAIFFVLLLAANQVSNSQNLVLNPGFETWNKITRPTGWSHVENCLKDSLTINSGLYSCMHSGGVSSTSDLGQTINIIPGHTYILSFSYQTIITSSGNGARIWCYWKDLEGKSITDQESDDLMRPSKYLKSDVWQNYSINIIAPPEAVSFYLEMRTYPNSIAYWDDVVFEEQVATLDYESDASYLKVYPNPAKDYLFINSAHDLQRIDILNIKGIVVWSGDFLSEEIVSIPLYGIPDGLYIIRMLTSEKQIVRKFIKKEY